MNRGRRGLRMDANSKGIPVIVVPAVSDENTSQIILTNNTLNYAVDPTSDDAVVLMAAADATYNDIDKVLIRYQLPDGTFSEIATLASVKANPDSDDQFLFTLSGESQVKVDNIVNTGSFSYDAEHVSGVSEGYYSPYEARSVLSGKEKKDLSRNVETLWGNLASVLARQGSKAITPSAKSTINSIISENPVAALNIIITRYGRQAGMGLHDFSYFIDLIETSNDLDSYVKKAISVSQELLVAPIQATQESAQDAALSMKEDLTKAQNDMMTRLKIDAHRKEIKKLTAELNGTEEQENESPEEKYTRLLDEKIEAGLLSDQIIAKCREEIQRLSSQAHGQTALNVLRGLLEYFPFGKDEIDRPSAEDAEQLLNEGHYGQDDVKKMILEYIIVELYKSKMDDPNYQGKPILLNGAPGIGKTTLAKSIAKATGRKFAAIACGGVSDTKLLTGHSSTYVGSKNGRIVQAFIDSGTEAPLLLLDEIDKIERGHNGDPSSVLMRLTDPSQNNHFEDEFFSVEFDLSKARIIATSNYIHKVDPVLRDRFEVIDLEGYSLDEKIEIIRNFVAPKEMEGAGLTKDTFTLSDDAVKYIIENYTNVSEPGVRTLEKIVQKVCRKAVKDIVQNGNTSVQITPEVLADPDWLGPSRARKPDVPQEDTVGWTTALAFSMAGGSAFPIKAELSRSVGTKSEKPIIRNKKLGDDMQYSIDSVHTIYKNLLERIKLSDEFNEQARKGFIDDLRQNFDIHADVTVDGPVDGPSAGVTFTTALVSRALNMPIDCKVAMTGKVDPRGNVKAIGGLEQKIPAARVAGMKKVIIPKENEKDYERLKPDQKAGVEVVFADTIEDVLKAAIPGIEKVIDFDQKLDQPTLPAVKALIEQKGAQSVTANDNEQGTVLAEEAPKKVTSRRSSPRLG